MSSRDEILGSYRLTKQIARGNATQIWECIKLGTTDRFVIKVLDKDNRGAKEEIAFLRHEFEVAHKLSHPNVIRVFEMNPVNPAYIVLEIFSTLNLKQVLRQDRERILVNFQSIAEQCGAGLAHLNEHGWVHCDVKPDNFLINESDAIKLIDFTIARKSATGLMAKLFGGQKVIRGTRSYMSPEQIRGKPIDDRGDVYSYACLLYELLTGKLPYTGTSPNELLSKHLTAPIPNVQVHNNNVTDDMSDLLRRAMAKEPAGRPKAMSEFLNQMKAIRIFRNAPKRSTPPAT